MSGPKGTRSRWILAAFIFVVGTAAFASLLLTAVRHEYDCKCGGDPLGWPALWYHPCGCGGVMVGGLLADLAAAALIPGSVGVFMFGLYLRRWMRAKPKAERTVTSALDVNG